MISPNILGHVVELAENREITKNKEGELVPGPMRTSLRLKLKNTLGKELSVWVDAPSEVNDFFSAEIPEEILQKSAIAAITSK